MLILPDKNMLPKKSILVYYLCLIEDNFDKKGVAMKTYLDCIPCFFRQVIETLKLCNIDESTQHQTVLELADRLKTFSLESSPPEIAREIHKILKKATGDDDLFREIKIKSNNIVLAIYDQLKQKVDSSKDKLLTAVELAIVGNIIDYGVKKGLDVDLEIKKILSEEHKAIKSTDERLFEYKKFKDTLIASDTILYLADNAGEIVFDRLLIELIHSKYPNKKIIFAVKEKPIINDAVLKDAYDCRIDEVAELISSGSDAPGTVLSLCNDKFMERYRSADMVISKGQGNFEALTDADRPIFFLFMAKCQVIADDISSRIAECQVGNIILHYHH